MQKKGTLKELKVAWGQGHGLMYVTVRSCMNVESIIGTISRGNQYSYQLNLLQVQLADRCTLRQQLQLYTRTPAGGYAHACYCTVAERETDL